MARAQTRRPNPSGGDLLPLVVIGVVAFAGYEWLRMHPGALGGSGSGGSAPGAPSLSYSTGSSTSATQTSAPAIRDPNFTAHAAGWRQARVANGQDPNDWSAFRTFELQIGAPDPGGVPVVGWPNAFGTVGGQLPGGY